MKVDKINLDLGNVWLFSSTSSSQKEKKKQKNRRFEKDETFLKFAQGRRYNRGHKMRQRSIFMDEIVPLI